MTQIGNHRKTARASAHRARTRELYGDPRALVAKLVRIGVRPVPSRDPSRFYFQAPGGPVYRVAPLDGAF